jgi:hypothetical protein
MDHRFITVGLSVVSDCQTQLGVLLFLQLKNLMHFSI